MELLAGLPQKNNVIEYIMYSSTKILMRYSLVLCNAQSLKIVEVCICFHKWSKWKARFSTDWENRVRFWSSSSTSTFMIATWDKCPVCMVKHACNLLKHA